MLKEGMDVDEDGFHTAQGRKRLAEDELTSEQRLSKRFHLLNLENARQLYIPTQQSSPTRRPRSNAMSDRMHVEDSKHRVYIHDLDEELASGESDEEKLIFLPDIERKLANLPKSVLTNEVAPKGKEVVLYSVPESLSVPRDEDKVRKAIIESRARAQEAHIDGIMEATDSHSPELQEGEGNPGAHTRVSYVQSNGCDEDNMDLEG